MGYKYAKCFCHFYSLFKKWLHLFTMRISNYAKQIHRSRVRVRPLNEFINGSILSIIWKTLHYFSRFTRHIICTKYQYRIRIANTRFDSVSISESNFIENHWSINQSIRTPVSTLHRSLFCPSALRDPGGTDFNTNMSALCSVQQEIRKLCPL